MKNLKSIIAICFAIGLVTGCSSKTTSTATTDTAATTQTTQATTQGATTESSTADTNSSTTGEATITGKVTAVDGSTVTVAAMGNGGGKGGQAPSGDSSQSAPSGDGKGGQAPAGGDSSSAPTDKPSDSSMGAGGAPQGGGDQAQGEEQTFTISDDSVITVEKDGASTAGSLTDITTDTMVSITYTTASDGTVTISKVVVQSGQPQGGAPGESSDSSTSK